MNKNKEKRIKARYFKWETFFVSLLFSLSNLPIYLIDHVTFPLLINILIIMTTLLITIWAYRNRAYAIPFIICETSQILMILLILTFSCFPAKDYKSWLFIKLTVLLVCIFLVSLSEIKVWNYRKIGWEQNGKININDSYFSILASSRPDPNNLSSYSSSTYLFFGGLLAPVIVALIIAFKINYLSRCTIEELVTHGIFILLMLLFELIFTPQAILIFKVLQIERNHHIRFKTEFSKMK